MIFKTNTKRLPVPKKSLSDPAIQASNRRKATGQTNKRINGAAKEVAAIWAAVEVEKVKEKEIKNNLTFYEYPNQVSITQEEINVIVDKWLNTKEGAIPFAWYFSEYDESAFESSVRQENEWIAVLAAAIIGFSIIDINTILRSERYRVALSTVQTENYRLIKNLSKKTSENVYKVIQDGIASGKSKSAIRRDIMTKFEIAKSSAKRITDTEVNKAANNARMSVIKTYNDAGENLGVMHISALLPTTRQQHANRHGKVYTVAQQTKWWNEGANRINCHCSVRSAPLTQNGEILNKEQQARIIQQGRDFFRR